MMSSSQRWNNMRALVATLECCASLPEWTWFVVGVLLLVVFFGAVLVLPVRPDDQEY